MNGLLKCSLHFDLHFSILLVYIDHTLKKKESDTCLWSGKTPQKQNLGKVVITTHQDSPFCSV